MRNGPRPCVPPDQCPVSKSETYDLNDRVVEGFQVPEAHAPYAGNRGPQLSVMGL
jgi:hypothetical protein